MERQRLGGRGIESESAQLATVPHVTGAAGKPHASYDAVAREYATKNETAPHNAFFERPAVINLLGDVAAKRVSMSAVAWARSHSTSSNTARRSSALMPARR